MMSLCHRRHLTITELLLPFHSISKLFLDVADDGDGADGDVDAAEGDGDQDVDALTGEEHHNKKGHESELNKRARRKTEADAKKLEVLPKQIDRQVSHSCVIKLSRL